MKMKRENLKSREFLQSKKKKIVQAWNGRLKQHLPFKDGTKLSAIKKEQEKGTDLLSIILEVDAKNEKDLLKKIISILKRIRSSSYSISNFSLEAYCLEEAVLQVLSEDNAPDGQLLQLYNEVRKDIFILTQIVLQQSADVYEYAIENGERAFCYFNCDGEILYTNDTMLSLMGVGELSKREKLADFFAETDSDFIQDLICGKLGKQGILRMLVFKNSKGKRLPVGAEISPIIVQGKRVGGYASLIDISKPMESQQKVYDKSPLGIIKINKKFKFTYANPVACEMLGAKSLVGKSVRDLFPEEKDWQKVEKHLLQKRFKNGLADEYEVEVSTLGDTPKRIPVRISGIPETDPKGEIIGSLAILHSLELEKASAAIHEKIESFKDIPTFFHDIGEEVARLVPFDEMIISTFSSDLQHVRSFSQTSDLGWKGVWWKIPPYVKKWVFDKHNFYVDDIAKFIDKLGQRKLQGDPLVHSLLQKNLLSMVRCPVFRENKLIATISFYRKGARAFSQREIDTIKRLPLHKATLMSRYAEEKNTLEFRLDLMNRILSVCHELDQIGPVIVKSLVEHYGWQNASFFLADEVDGTFSLKGQKALGDKKVFLLAKNYRQSLKEGILGYVYKYKKPVNISNVKTDTKFQKYYVEGYKKTLSEFCVPIIVEGKVSWLLNLEDDRENAFSKDEIDSLTLIINEVGEILKRAYTNHIYKVTLESTSDAIIITDHQGKVKEINPAAEVMLELKLQHLKGKSLRKYFEDKKLFDLLQTEQGSITGKEVNIRAASGRKNYVLMSSSPLLTELGGRVFLARDLSLLKRVKELEYLDQMTYEVALQTKTPLSLMFSWLKRIEKKIAADQLELIDKITRQLRKIELTTDRLALFDPEKGVIPYDEVKLDFSEVIKIISKDFPKSELSKINFEMDDVAPSFRGDIFQIKFCLETILSYLLRYLPEDEKINFTITGNKKWVKCNIKGFLPKQKDDGRPEDKAAIRQTLVDISLGEPVIKKFVSNHGGKYYTPKQKGTHVVFRIDLPIRK